eukprot:6581027-Lingulodinium_polyedra.AAC.1
MSCLIGMTRLSTLSASKVIRLAAASYRDEATSPATPAVRLAATSGSILHGPERSADASAPHARRN